MYDICDLYLMPDKHVQKTDMSGKQGIHIHVDASHSVCHIVG